MTSQNRCVNSKSEQVSLKGSCEMLKSRLQKVREMSFTVLARDGCVDRSKCEINCRPKQEHVTEFSHFLQPRLRHLITPFQRHLLTFTVDTIDLKSFQKHCVNCKCEQASLKGSYEMLK